MHPTKTAYGTWSGGRFMHFGLCLSEERYIASIHHAYDKGIRTFMTADVYGTGDSDEILGRALAAFPRDSYCLIGAIGHDFYKGERAGSKGFPRFTDPAMHAPEQWSEYVKTSTEKSLERIGVDKFDLLLLHNPDHTGFSDQRVWDAMATTKSDGLTELVGIAPGPANGFTLDVIDCFEKFGEEYIDWAMLILNPFEPWPGQLALPAAEKFGVKVITRVVDYGGIFHDDIKPGHPFPERDHRKFRPDGWVEAGCEKLEKVRPIIEAHGITPLQFSCAWNLSHPAVNSVVPTLIQEPGDVKSIEDKIDELAQLPDVTFTEKELETIAEIGDNKGCMTLKGGNHEHKGDPLPDRWALDDDLIAAGERWGVSSEKDLANVHA
ncbi:MAG: aryl-alcohol dehydrogenase-like predicted oxidoreductase [Verrucomicrobiales bacterium]|jgi:aryl-alcohol dehydrogenase-like predicted oxidoreductase